jgi:hypothetical protein
MPSSMLPPATVAHAALGWIAAEPRRLAAFLAATGLAPGAIGGRIGEPAFQAAVLDHLMADERALLAFCAAEGLPPEAPRSARAALPGGELPHWT